jgi:hypothetical protein
MSVLRPKRDALYKCRMPAGSRGCWLSTIFSAYPLDLLLPQDGSPNFTLYISGRNTSLTTPFLLLQAVVWTAFCGLFCIVSGLRRAERALPVFNWVKHCLVSNSKNKHHPPITSYQTFLWNLNQLHVMVRLSLSNALSTASTQPSHSLHTTFAQPTIVIYRALIPPLRSRGRPSPAICTLSVVLILLPAFLGHRRWSDATSSSR